MGSVQYGTRKIEYTIVKNDNLTAHYITVDKHAGVVLKGKLVPEKVADGLILKKAKWIINKLDLVKSRDEGELVTGSRLPYLGKTYYVKIVADKSVDKVVVTFNYSRFTITIKNHSVSQEEINAAIQLFYKEKAVEKITPRVEKLSLKTGLKYTRLSFRKMAKRWGSCTGKDSIFINYEAVKLPYSLIDYLIVHELVHTKVKDHSKKYWKELARHMRGWKEYDEKMKNMGM